MGKSRLNLFPTICLSVAGKGAFRYRCVHITWSTNAKINKQKMRRRERKEIVLLPPLMANIPQPWDCQRTSHPPWTNLVQSHQNRKQVPSFQEANCVQFFICKLLFCNPSSSLFCNGLFLFDCRPAGKPHLTARRLAACSNSTMKDQRLMMVQWPYPASKRMGIFWWVNIKSLYTLLLFNSAQFHIKPEENLTVCAVLVTSVLLSQRPLIIIL